MGFFVSARRCARLSLWVAPLLCSTSVRAADAPFAFTKIIDNAAVLPVPNPPASFYFSGPVFLDGSKLTFTTYNGLPEHGVFIFDGSAVSPVIYRGATLPNGPTAQYVTGVGRYGATTVFADADLYEFKGIYQSVGGSLTTLVDRTTTLPTVAVGAAPVTVQQARVTADAGVVAFQADTTDGGVGGLRQGIYTNASGTFKPVVDHTTPVPGIPDAFFASVSTPVLAGGKVVFSAQGYAKANLAYVPGQAIYAVDSSGGQLTRMVDLSTPKPGGGTFGDLVHGAGDVLVLNGSDGFDAVFQVINTKALYASVDGVIRTVADTSTVVPGGTKAFTSFGSALIDDGRVIFAASEGVFEWEDGALTRIVSAGDVVNGKTVSFFDISGDPLDGDRLAVRLSFSDNSSGIYLTQVPEPGSMGLILAVSGTTVLGRRRRRS